MYVSINILLESLGKVDNFVTVLDALAVIRTDITIVSSVSITILPPVYALPV